MVTRNGPPTEEPPAEAISPRYTGKIRGTKRSRSREGMERFNNLAVLVYNDRRERGEEFDQWFLQEMIESYGNQNRNAGREATETEVVDAAPTIVYNEFNMQLLMAVHRTKSSNHQLQKKMMWIEFKLCRYCTVQ